jgi:uncharacterized membrane protein (TIGR02234 family)
VHADLTGMLAGTPQVDVPGSQAAPVVPAVALVALAAAAAASIAGRAGRWLAGAVVTLAGLAAVAGTLALLADPVAAADARLAEVTAGTGVPADAVTVTAWPALTLVPATVLALAGLLVVVTGRRWDTGRRFEAAPAGDRGPEPVSDWDALTRGTDPTAPGADRPEGRRD